MRVEQFIRNIVDRLAAIEDALKQQQHTVTENGESTRNEQRQGAQSIASAIDKAAAEVSHSEQAQRDKEYRLQVYS